MRWRYIVWSELFEIMGRPVILVHTRKRSRLGEFTQTSVYGDGEIVWC
jgi:hypothetical protein